MRVSLTLISLVSFYYFGASEGSGAFISYSSYTLKSRTNFKSGATILFENYGQYFIKDVLRMSDLDDICLRHLLNKSKFVGNATCETVMQMVFKNSTLLKLPTALFAKLPNLKIFIARDVNLMQIYRNDFESLKQLNILNLSDNLIAMLEDGIFSHLKELNVLNLSNNKITALFEETFIGMGDNLYQLDLSGNKITVLDYVVFIPLAHQKQYPLELMLNNNDIKRVVESHRVHHLQFQTLSLKNNHIAGFSCPDVKIVELELASNRMQSVMLDNCSVEYMVVKNNSLKSLHLHSEMQGVAAGGNKIRSIVVGESPKISHLDMGEIEDLSLVLPSLRTMTEMMNLNISYSRIEKLNGDTFGEMEKLQRLYMRGCGLQIIPFELFVNNKELRLLDISLNQLETIDLHMFTGLNELTQLNIAGNKLSRIANIENIKNVLPKLKEVTLDGNPWKCIELSTIARTLKHSNVNISESGRKNFAVQHILGIPCH
jgi:Leucine-rich repeat (LRR) protein